MKRKIVLAVVILSSLILGACGLRSKTNEDAALAPVPSEFAGKTNPFDGGDAAAAGADIFKTSCEVCHGPQGHGDGPAGAALDPAPKDLAKLQASAGDDYLYWRISTGKEGTAMVAWKGVLTDEQIWQLVAFINTLK